MIEHSTNTRTINFQIPPGILHEGLSWVDIEHQFYVNLATIRENCTNISLPHTHIANTFSAISWRDAGDAVPSAHALEQVA